MANKPPDLVSAAETAKILRVDRSTVSRMAADGRLAVAFRGSGTTGEKFFNRSDVEALLNPPVDSVTPNTESTGFSASERKVS